MVLTTTLEQELARNELVLRALREACRDTPLFTESKVSFIDVTTCSMDKLYLNGEGQWGWQEFFHRYFEEARNPTPQGNRLSVLTRLFSRAPGWVRWRTENRLAYGEYRAQIIEAFRGLPVSVSEDSGWSWLRGSDSERPEGKAQYKPDYGFLLSFNDRCKFDPEPVISGMTKICMSNDPRADRNIFELVEDSGFRICDGGYKWTTTGFILRVWAKKEVERLRKLFTDCVTVLNKETTSQGPAWVLSVDFPA